MGASFEFAAELASSGFLEAGFLAHEQAGVGSDRPDVDPVADFLEGTPLLRRGEAVQLVRVFVVDEVHGVAVDGAFRRDDGLGLGRRRRGLFSFRGGVVLLESDDAVMQRADDPGISVAELFSSGGRVGPASVEAGLQVLVSSVRIGAAVDFEARRNQGVDDDVPMFVVDRTAETVRTTADLAAQTRSSFFFEAGQLLACQSAGTSYRPDVDLRSLFENPALLLRRRTENLWLPSSYTMTISLPARGPSVAKRNSSVAGGCFVGKKSSSESPSSSSESNSSSESSYSETSAGKPRTARCTASDNGTPH
mmetsp:Transcript_14732/g.48068  ORF Transcript_14732/g.48068 Transcript_14732/m.48068 type:complete len:308 (-) Transcript_14732:133-1056(-)